jgi:sterol desaturase/sphingolipid hydroxylase (fatty acid hydroxylase superfamily)
VEEFRALLLSNVEYQLLGVAVCLPLELYLPTGRMTFVDRFRGVIFLLAGAVALALLGAALGWMKATLGIEPLLSLHYAFGLPIIASIILSLWLDLQFYTMHRLQHRFFWRFHAVHHSVRNLSAANSYHHWTEPLMNLTVFVPLMFLDVQIAPTLGVLTFVFRLQHFYVHSSSEPHFGGLRCVLVDNRYHRIHHSIDPAHHDTNFGAMTPLWDWLFGTLYMPTSDEWPDVGLAEIDEPKSLARWSSLPWRYPRLTLEHTSTCDLRKAL